MSIVRLAAAVSLGIRFPVVWEVAIILESVLQERSTATVPSTQIALQPTATTASQILNRQQAPLKLVIV